MNEVDERLAEIEDVISGGEKIIQKGDRRVEYRSLNELERIEDKLKRKKHRRRPFLSTRTNINRDL